jgi:hypothetical protein
MERKVEMPIPRSGSVGGEFPPNGIQARFRIDEATFRPETRFSPDIELSLSMIDKAYFGTPARFWVRLSQPRLDRVRKLRSEGTSDTLIKEILKEQGYTFTKVDEPEDPQVNRGGNTYKTLVAVCGGSYAESEKVLDEIDSYDELAAFFKGKTFVATIRLKERDGKQYVNINGEEPVFPDYGPAEAVDEANAADAEELPDFPKDWGPEANPAA